MNNEPDYDNLYFEPKAKGTLTEQWKRGELPEGWYYVIKTGDVEMLEYCCDCFLAGDVPLIDNEVTGVLAPVPSYDEWQASYNCMLENEVLRLKNAQLKELLKECKDLIELMQAISGIKQIKFTVIDDFVKKINEVLDA